MPTPKAYYNEWDPFAAAWLRELVREGLIADGDVDSRSIREVRASDLAGYTQVHFFAGIGGWSLALRLAGWDDSRPVWTGSCPCQPFSAAGNLRGEADERHLWPEMRRLIQFGGPSTVFGEQVASPLGRSWLTRVRTDLEDMGYAVGAADLCAAGVGAPHIRQRLYWVAHSERIGLSGGLLQCSEPTADFPAKDTCDPVSTYSQWEKGDSISPLPVLANGIPGDMAASRGFGNAIVPQVGAAFIQASIEALK